jgi:hypothetical protein
MHRIRVMLAAAFLFGSIALVESSNGGEPVDGQLKPHAPAKPLVWLNDYRAATNQAKAENKLVLIHFYRESDQAKKEARAAIDSIANIEKALEEPGVRERLDRYVLAKLPVDAEIKIDGEPTRLLRHGAFSEIRNGPGLAIIDYANEKTEHYGYVVSVIPFTPGKYYRFRSSQLVTLLDLPAGTLTQRSMIFAVRIHPERPASTTGEDDPVLLSEAKSHSEYQAQVRVQGHHHWDSRFMRIIGRLLGRGKSGSPVEVVAESWPQQDLMDSCVDCVASWRQSDGHWSAVSAKQASYGYDIRLSDNGIWYATGIFREAK